MILADGLIPFLLHLESYLLYEKVHKVEHCHQLRLLLVQRLEASLKMMKSSFIFSFLQAYHQLLYAKKENWYKDRIG